MSSRRRNPKTVGIENAMRYGHHDSFPIHFLLTFITSVEQLRETVACKDWHQFIPKQNCPRAQDLEAVYTRIAQNTRAQKTLDLALASLGRKSIYIVSYEVSKNILNSKHLAACSGSEDMK